MRLRRPRTLFGKTLATIALVAVGFQLFTLGVIAYQMLVPLGKRSADDLATLMINAAKSWQSASNLQRPMVAANTKRDAMLTVGTADQALPASDSWLPYRFFVESALERRLGEPVRLLGSVEPDGAAWYWADIPIAGESVRIGFPRSRIEVGPLMALVLVLTVGTWVTLITAIALARRLAAPLERLSGAAASIGSGQWPEPLPETGPRELASLTASFNRMTNQVRELIANRTVLLAGISHDLRTPITQIMLAIEMLSVRDSDLELVTGIRRDLDNMNRLIGQFLEISRELEASDGEPMMLEALMQELSQGFSERGANIACTRCDNCLRIQHPLALRRVLGNLMENALRYGEGSPVDVGCCCSEGTLQIQICDRGPGIPAAEREAVFRPFHRLEGSRSNQTGGSGLGLAIVKQLADAHGWQVALTPRNGGGTVATVTIATS